MASDSGRRWDQQRSYSACFAGTRLKLLVRNTTGAGEALVVWKGTYVTVRDRSAVFRRASVYMINTTEPILGS